MEYGVQMESFLCPAGKANDYQVGDFLLTIFAISFQPACWNCCQGHWYKRILY